MTVKYQVDRLEDVAEGLREHYTADGDKFIDIYRVNRDVIPSPDELIPGTILLIPDVK